MKKHLWIVIAVAAVVVFVLLPRLPGCQDRQPPVTVTHTRTTTDSVKIETKDSVNVVQEQQDSTRVTVRGKWTPPATPPELQEHVPEHPERESFEFEVIVETGSKQRQDTKKDTERSETITRKTTDSTTMAHRAQKGRIGVSVAGSINSTMDEASVHPAAMLDYRLWRTLGITAGVRVWQSDAWEVSPQVGLNVAILTNKKGSGVYLSPVYDLRGGVWINLKLLVMLL